VLHPLPLLGVLGRQLDLGLQVQEAALHVAGAQSPATVPRVEFLIRAQEGKQFFQKEIYRPENGMVTLPTLPGIGIVLDESKIEAQERLTF
jgi:L-alanine-DL-glutamate epimerase-like enolase superfamily enzyme